MNKKHLRTIGIVSIILGCSLFIFLGAASIWAEIEASFFNSALRSDEPLDALSCPTFINQDEVGTVTGRFYNPTEKTAEMDIRTYVTAGFVTLMDEFITTFTLGPGETKVVEVPVTAENAAYNRLVLVRMHQMKRNPFPYQNASCGIVVVNTFLLTGSQFLTLMIVLAVVFSSGGLLLWAQFSKPIIKERLLVFSAMIFLTVVAVSVAIAGLLNLWLLGIGLLVIWILMGTGMIWQFSTRAAGIESVTPTKIKRQL